MASRQNPRCGGNVLLFDYWFCCWDWRGNGHTISVVCKLKCFDTAFIGWLSFSKQNVCCWHGGGIFVWKIRGWARFIFLFCLWGVVFVLNTTDGSRNWDLERWHAVSYFFMNCDKDSDEISIVTRSIFARLMLAFLFWDFCGILFLQVLRPCV